MKYFALIFAFIFFQGKVHSDPDPKAVQSGLKKWKKCTIHFQALRLI
jgi:hypothetical protein